MTATLEPEPTKWDQRVLKALKEPSDLRDPSSWMSAWQVAEAVNEENVALVRMALHGLEDLGYAMSRGFPPRKQWVRLPCGRRT